MLCPIGRLHWWWCPKRYWSHCLQQLWMLQQWQCPEYGPAPYRQWSVCWCLSHLWTGLSIYYQVSQLRNRTSWLFKKKKHMILCVYVCVCLVCYVDIRIYMCLDYICMWVYYYTGRYSYSLSHIVCKAYHVPNWLVTPKACKTNTPANTATRSPGTCALPFTQPLHIYNA